MPRKWPVNGPSLAIQLDEPGPFLPGDVISGNVIRRLPFDTKRARLTIQLRGRDKVKLTPQPSLLPTTFRARANFFGDGVHETLHDGPVCFGTSPFTGPPILREPFTFTLPTHDINHRPLPFSFSTRIRSGRSTLRAFVDYWLEASLSDHASPGWRRTTAIQPLTVHHPAPPPLSLPPSLTTTTYRRTVHSPLLLAPVLPPSQTLASKLGSIRRRPSRPSLASHPAPPPDKLAKTDDNPHQTFTISLLTPRSLQLDAPTPLPLYLRTAPIPALSSPCLRQKSQLVALLSLSVHLVARTTVNVRGKSSCHDEVTCGAEWKVGEREAFWLPFDEGEEGEGVVDVARCVLGLRFGVDGVWVREVGAKGWGELVGVKGEEGRVVPDFETYNVRRGYLLRWDLEVRIAGEVVRVKGEEGVRVFGAAAKAEGADGAEGRDGEAAGKREDGTSEGTGEMSFETARTTVERKDVLVRKKEVGKRMSA